MTTESVTQELGFSTETPNGTRIYYQAKPKRLYRVNDVESISVTTALDCLNKPGLSWWGMRVGVDGVQRLIDAGLVSFGLKEVDGVQVPTLIVQEDISKNPAVQEWVWQYATSFLDRPGNLEALLTREKLTVNHIRDKAGDRGNNVHSAMENWIKEGTIPHLPFYPETEQGYVSGLMKFLADVGSIDHKKHKTEIMVGSPMFAFAGRYDWRGPLPACSLVISPERYTPTGIKRDEIRTSIKKGEWLLDLKTSKDVYETHLLQLEGYEGASIECGYKPTVGRMVIIVDPTGGYKVEVSKAEYDDFLAVLATTRHLKALDERRRALDPPPAPKAETTRPTGGDDQSERKTGGIGE